MAATTLRIGSNGQHEMTTMEKMDYLSLIRLLAAGLKSYPPGHQTKLVLFLGAGAPRAAGLPLASELKELVLNSFKGVKVPKGVEEGTLEDLMQTLQSSLGNAGYELVAERVRRHKTLPPSYERIRKLIADDYVEAVITTNFDLLFDVMSAYAGVRLHFMNDDDSFETQIPKSATLIAQLHGSAADPAAMRGSTTDANRKLPVRRAEVLKEVMRNHLTVFVGYAARDKDIIPVLQEVAAEPSRKPIWWVNPNDEPPAEIRAVLDVFGSQTNYLPIDSEKFFASLDDALAPEPHPSGGSAARALEIIRRLHSGDASRRSLDDRDRLLIRQKQERDFIENVTNFCFALLKRYHDEEHSTVLHSMASRPLAFSDLDSGPFAAIVKILSRHHYTCMRVPTLTGGSMELVLHPVQEDRGEGLEHEVGLNVVAAVFLFGKRDLEGYGVGKGKVWEALVHRIDFPANTASLGVLQAWLNGEVPQAFERSLDRLSKDTEIE